MAAAVGAERVGIRIAPFNMFLAAYDSNPMELYGHLIPALSDLKLAYIHMIMPRQFEAGTEEENAKLYALRALFKGPALLAGGFDAASGACCRPPQRNLPWRGCPEMRSGEAATGQKNE